MLLPVYTYGQPVLRKIAEDISPDFPGLKELIENMFETMYSAEGVGLAAPQIGEAIRLFVIDGTPMADDEDGDAEKLTGFKKVFINPKIIEELGENITYNEGCLSVPSIRENVVRKQKIRIQYMDENFVQHDEYFEDTKAWIIQHEYDHLEGKVFIDRISPIRRKLLTGKINNIIKGIVRVNYKVKFASPKLKR